MKQEALERINSIGRIGLILTVIMSFACYMFMIFMIGAAIIIHNVPASLANVELSAQMLVDADFTGANLESAAVHTLQGYLTEGQGAAVSFGSIVLYLTEYVPNSVGGTGTFGGILSTFSLNQLWVLPLYVVIILAATVVMLLFNGFFTRTLKHCKNPFDEAVIKDATNFSYALVIWGFIVAGVSAMLEGVFTGTVKIGTTGMTIIVLCIVIFFFIRIWKNAAIIHNN